MNWQIFNTLISILSKLHWTDLDPLLEQKINMIGHFRKRRIIIFQMYKYIGTEHHLSQMVYS